MYKNFFVYLLILLLSLSLIACSDDPTSVGSNLIPGEDNIKFDLLDTYQDSVNQSSSFYKDTLNLAGSSVILLGKTDFAESRFLIKFFPTVPDSILTYYKNGQAFVKQAWINFKTLYRLGDKNSNFDFSIHQIRQNWALNFNEDSLASFQYDNVNVGSNVTVTDTSVSVKLQTGVLDEWIQYRDSTISTVNYGLYFVPSQNSEQILGFRGISYAADTAQPTVYFVFEKPNEWVDTLYILPAQNKHVILSSTPQSSDEIYLQAGYGLRGQLYFDLSKLKKGSIINKAILELTGDMSKSALSSTLNDSSVSVTRYGDSLRTKLTSDSLVVVSLTRSGNVYSGNISYFVQNWVNNGKNYGMRLTMGDELGSASRLVFFGSSYIEADKRPRLKITYVQKN